MKCIDCKQLDLEKNPGQARIGFGRCAFETQPGVFESMLWERQCPRFEKAQEGTVAVRRKTYARQQTHDNGQPL